MSQNSEWPRERRKGRENRCNGNSQASRGTSDPVRDRTALYRFWKERIDRLEEYLNRKDQ